MKQEFKDITQNIWNPNFHDDRKRDYKFIWELWKKTIVEQELIKNNFLEVLYNKETKWNNIKIFKVFPKWWALWKMG